MEIFDIKEIKNFNQKIDKKIEKDENSNLKPP